MNLDMSKNKKAGVHVKKEWFVKDRPLVMAHRGDQASAPENTILALENAVKMGADVIETDVRITKDEQLVLFHDESVDRTTDGSGKISDLTLDELKTLDFGWKFSQDGGKTYPFRGKGLTVVTLKEAFLKFPEIAFNIDIKDEDPVVPDLLARIIKEHDREDSVIVASFHPRQVERIRTLLPTLKTAAHPLEVKRFVTLLTVRIPHFFIRNLSYSAFQVPLEYGGRRIVTKRFIRMAHRKNILVHVWTINNRKTMKHLIKSGVDGIFTDKPSLLIEVLKEFGLM